MATYQSTQTSNWAGGTSVTITKPTSLAAGDTLVAHLGAAATSGTPGAFTVPSGWTEQSNIVSTGITSNLVRMQIFTKVADSADAAASNFTFTASGHSGFVAGGLTRLTDMGIVSGSANTTQNDATTSPVTFSGFTPSRSGNLMMIFAVTWATSGSIGVFSGFSVTTDNPTWTKRYDLNNGVDRMALALATGPRTGANATGTVSVTATLPTAADTIIVMLAMSDTVNGSVTVGDQKVAAYAFTPIQETEAVFDGTDPQTNVHNKALWVNEERGTTAWTNETR